MESFKIAEMLKGERTNGFVREISKDIYEIIDFYYDPDYSYILIDNIDLESFSKEKMLDAISYFDFESIEEVIMEFGDTYKSIVAQCLHMTEGQYHLSKRLDMETKELLEYIKDEYDIEIDLTKFNF